MNEPTWVSWAQGIAAIVTILMLLVLGPIARLVWKIRTNDLAHLDQKIDTNHKVQMGAVKEVRTAVSEVDKKLAAHIDWHLNQ